VKLRLIKRHRPYEGRVFSVVVDDVEYPSGRPSVREVAEHAGGSVALALFPDRRTILVRQHRYPFGEFIPELPAGKLDPGEDPLHCAKRELEEETGYLASRWKRLATIYPSPGFCSEVLHIFLAEELTPAPGGRKLEEGEQTMTMEILPLAEAAGMIDRGEIKDAKTICGILMTERLLREERTA
jgi:ADP-ribose pyrophosphatase